MQAGCQQRDEMEMICLYLCRKEVENLHKNYKWIADSRTSWIEEQVALFLLMNTSDRNTSNNLTFLITCHFTKSSFYDAINFF